MDKDPITFFIEDLLLPILAIAIVGAIAVAACTGAYMLLDYAINGRCYIWITR